MPSSGLGVRRAYRSSRREAQALHTRRRVLDAARSAFLDRGYAGATIRVIAAGAGVSVPTVEAVFGTKARLLKAVIDVAIAGDDAPVAVLDRSWADAAIEADTADEFLAIVAGVIGPAQVRSAGLVLAALEGSSTDAELAELAEELITQRAVTATWLVDALRRRAPLSRGCSRQEAIDTMWILMDPAVFVRLTRQRQWTTRRYQRWLACSVGRLLIADAPTPTSTAVSRGRKST